MSLRHARIGRRRTRSTGQALVEFALVAPLFFFLLFAIIDFGRYVYYVQVLNNAAREGARYGIVHGSASLAPSGPPEYPTTSVDLNGDRIRSVVRNYAIGVIGNTSALTINLDWVDPNTGLSSDNRRGNTVTVVALYQFRSLIPVVPLPKLQIEGTSTLVINH